MLDLLHAVPAAVYFYLILINALTFLVFGSDKSRARKGRRRVPEKTLFLLAAAGGSIGAIFAMRVFRHKTRHLSFRYGIPGILLLQLFAIVLLLWV